MARKKAAIAEPDAAPDEPKEDPERRIVYDWHDGPAHWGMQANGHYRGLAYGEIVPQCTVRPKWGDTRKRGTVLALVSGYGYPLRMQAMVNWGKPALLRPWVQVKGGPAEPKDVLRWWPADELEAVKT